MEFEGVFVNEKIGILLVNLGSPAQPTVKATRKYLAQFLSDKRVIELSRILWLPILHGIVLRTRPARSAKAYASVWRTEENGEFAKYSTLIETTMSQANALEAQIGGSTIVRAAMRYGQPSIQSGLVELRDLNCTKILVLPLYPQYAGATTESVYDEVARVEKKLGNLPPLELMRNYFDHPDYISAVANSLTTYVENLDWTADKILVSFHGLPSSSIEKGDPYESECERTYELLVQHSPKLRDKLMLTYQSRFGPKEWLGPYTATTLDEMAKAGKKNIVIIAPGFSADCLETLEELSINAKKSFLAQGGENLSLVPCLNVEASHIKLMETLIQARLTHK